MSPPEIRLEDFFSYYSGEADQREGVAMLAHTISPALLKDDSAWVKAYRGQLPQQQQQPDIQGSLLNPLDVDHDSQYNNPSNEGWRECFSSSCAMAAKYWGVIKDFNEYHQRRPEFGDSTDASAQVRTLKSFGLDAKFVQIGSVEKLKQQIDLGRPTPVGYLHKGTGHGTGGGHYCLCIGYDETGFWMNDPGGELDCRNGGFISTEQYAGRKVHYSYEHWVPRWSVASDADGWGVGITRPVDETTPGK